MKQPTPHEEPDVASRFGDRGRLTVIIAIALVVLGVLSMISPRLIFTPTLATYGDLGAHVYPLREFVDRLIPSGAVAGWTHGWFAGMPLFYFYFPLPALLVAALTPLAGFEIAVKIMVALGPLSLPPAAYAVLRATGMSRWWAGSGAVVGSSYLLMHSFSTHGGNLLSTYLGEYSYTISFTFSLLYLAVVLKAARTGVAAPLAAGALLCLTALSHVLTTAAVVLVTIPLVAHERYARTVLSSWFLGFLLAGFWAFPFLARLPFGSTPPWTYDPSIQELLPLELLPLIPLAFFGGWKVWRGRRWHGLPLLLVPLCAAIVWAVPQEFIHPGRLLPYAYFMVHALAGVALGVALQAAAEKRSRWAIGAATFIVWLLIVLNVARDPRQVHAFVENAMAGYPEAENWDEYTDIVDAVSGLPPGRLFWETSNRTLTYGSQLALTIMPYWSPDHPVLSGLWTQSSATEPFHLLLSREVGDTAVYGPKVPGHFWRDFDFERGIDHARVLGGRYFLAYSDRLLQLADAHPEVEPVVRSDDWAVYEVLGVESVSPATRTPVVYPGSDFTEVAHRWFDAEPPVEPWVVDRGPMDWPRVESDLSSSAEAPSLDGVRASVTDVEFGPERISFKTEAVGVPHLVRVSFFPNWVAVGANGPYRAAPSFMVVVPTAEEVELLFVDTWVEWVARGLTLMGLFLAMLVVAQSGRTGGGRRRSGDRAFS